MSLAELRERTRPCHAQLDERLQLFTTVQSQEDYRAHLFRFFQIFHHAEKALHAYPTWREFGVEWAEREKSSLLRADLLALGIGESDLENIPLPEPLPPHSSFAEAVGSLYVLEGSTLGGQYISRHYQAKLGLRAESGLSFHSGYGAETGARWQSFCASLENIFRAYPQSKEEILDAACAAFAAVEKILCEAPTPAKGGHLAN